MALNIKLLPVAWVEATDATEKTFHNEP